MSAESRPRIRWAKCSECGAEVMFDAWVDCNGELMMGPFDDCRCSNGDCDAINPDYDIVEGNRPITGETDERHTGTVAN